MGETLMTEQKAVKRKNPTPTSYLCNKDEKNRYQCVIDADIYRELEDMTLLHPSILPIAQNIADFFSELIHEDGAPLVDLILAHALTEWSTRYQSEGCNTAFRAYCTSIFKVLPKAFEFRVTGLRGVKPFPHVTWDATKMGLVEWMSIHKVTHLKVERVVNSSALSARELAFLLVGHIFERPELKIWGVTDVYEQVSLGHDDVKPVYVKPSQKDRVSAKRGPGRPRAQNEDVNS